METDVNSLPEVSEEVKETENNYKLNLKDIQPLLSEAKNLVELQENIWKQVQDEFKINSAQMKPIIDYNEHHMLIPEGVDVNDTNTYTEDFDFFNGLDNIPEDKLLEIFGEDSALFGVEYSQTVDRLKWAATTFRDYLTTLFSFNDISREYSNLIEEQEQANVQAMKLAIETCEDPKKKIELESNLKNYFYYKELEFLSEQLDEITKDHITSTFNDGRKIQYIIDRSRVKLKKLKISEKFILEIASFEKLYLEEKYHKQDNLLLVYFMNLIVYSDIDGQNDVRRKVLSIVVNIDKYIRKGFNDEETTKIILKNILALEDQFLGNVK